MDEQAIENEWRSHHTMFLDWCRFPLKCLFRQSPCDKRVTIELLGI